MITRNYPRIAKMSVPLSPGARPNPREAECPGPIVSPFLYTAQVNSQVTVVTPSEVSREPSLSKLRNALFTREPLRVNYAR